VERKDMFDLNALNFEEKRTRKGGKIARFLQCCNCGEEGLQQHYSPKPKGMVNYGRESPANIHQTT